jgi:hypothetical protein
MVEKHFESVADAAKLPSVAANVVEDRLLYLGMWRLAQVDVDEAKLRSLLIKCPWIDRLPESFRRQ